MPKSAYDQFADALGGLDCDVTIPISVLSHLLDDPLPWSQRQEIIDQAIQQATATLQADPVTADHMARFKV